MPIKNGIGQSQYTPIKLTHLRQIMETHIAITSAVINKNTYWNKQYLYIDATAGPGYYPGDAELHKGSPMIFAESIENNKMPYEAYFIEQDTNHLKTLISHIPANFQCNPRHGCYEDIIPVITNQEDKKQLGLLYIDPNNVMPDINTIKHVSEYRPKMEILVYLAAAALKRTDKQLVNYIESGKKSWLIRKSFGKWQYTFLLGTNSPDRIFHNKFESIDMFSLDTAKGKERFERMQYTKKQRERLHQSEFDFAESTEKHMGFLDENQS